MDVGLRDEDPDRRVEALKRILKSQDRAALDGVVERLGQEKDPRVRVAMVYTLGVLGDRTHVPLLAYLCQARDVELRLRAVQALAKIRHPAGFPSMIRCLATDPDERVRRVAFQAVVRVGSDNLLTLLQRMIASRKDWQRECAILVCAQFNSPLVVPLLVEAHGAGTEEEAALALRGLEQLARLGNELAREALDRIRSRDRELEAVRSALEAQMKKLWELDKESFDFEKSHTGGLQRVEIEVSPVSGETVPPEAASARPAPPADRPATVLSPDDSFFDRPVEEADFDDSRTIDRIEAFEPDAVARLESKVNALSRRVDTREPQVDVPEVTPEPVGLPPAPVRRTVSALAPAIAAPTAVPAAATSAPAAAATSPATTPAAPASPARDRRKLLLQVLGLLFPLIAVPLLWMAFAPEPEPLPLEQAPVRSSSTNRFDRGGPAPGASPR